MYDLLTDQLIRTRLTDGAIEVMSLPGILAALKRDQVASFSALRPHQHHAWHAFLAQLATIALHRSGTTEFPATAAGWRKILSVLTSNWQNGDPWQLIVDDPTQPAFMQPPLTVDFGAYRKLIQTPDELDSVLLTSKNHDIKQQIAMHCNVDDWIFALVSVQTMTGFRGSGNYGIVRMNGGLSSRSCLGLRPDRGGIGTHVCFDVARMLEHRPKLLDNYPDYFRPADGKSLLWLEPWSGECNDKLALRELDPYFIEVCRRVRLVIQGSRIVSRAATSKATRIEAGSSGGNVGDFWTPVKTNDQKALSLSNTGFRYDRLVDMILPEQGKFVQPPAMSVSRVPSQGYRLVARGMAAGQGKTEGYHERNDITFDPSTARALGGAGGRGRLAEAAKAQLKEIAAIQKALRFGIAIAASGGKDAQDLTKADRGYGTPYVRRLDTIANAVFFRELQHRYGAIGTEQRMKFRKTFAKMLIRAAEQLLDEAIETVPYPVIRRYRARTRARRGFFRELKRSGSEFADQPDIFETSGREGRDVA